MPIVPEKGMVNKNSPSFSAGKRPVCSYVSPADGWRCNEPVWVHSQHRYCIGHAQETEKSPLDFLDLIKKKVYFDDLVFDGFIFPFRIQIKNTAFKNPLSFYGCTFLDGLKFENVRFHGAFTVFDNCMFFGSSVYFNRSLFAGKKVSFANSFFEGEIFAFSDCYFASEITDFSSLHWTGVKAIAFLRSSFQGNEVFFTSAELNAPIIAFKGISVSAQKMEFDKTCFHAKEQFFKGIIQTHGDMLFHAVHFNCKHLKFTGNQWNGTSHSFKKTVWKGKEFVFGSNTVIKGTVIFDRCQLDGETIDYSGLEVKNSFVLSDSEFKAQNRIDFSKMRSTNKVVVQNNSFSTPHLIMDSISAGGKDFVFQRNHVDGASFRCVSSTFHTDRVSFNSSVFRNHTFDFGNTLFENKQTSFNDLHITGKTVSYRNTRFCSKRVSFNLTRFTSEKIYLDNAFFGAGFVSFWKTDFGKAEVSFRNAMDDGAILRFSTGLSNTRFLGNKLHNCDFEDSVWNSTGFIKRPCTAEEEDLIANGCFEEVQKLYLWIAKQYEESGQKQKQRDFLYSLREIQRLERKFHGSWGEFLHLEFSKWLFGYGLGLKHVGLLQSAASQCAAIITLLHKLR